MPYTCIYAYHNIYIHTCLMYAYCIYITNVTCMFTKAINICIGVYVYIHVNMPISPSIPSLSASTLCLIREVSSVATI